MPEHTIAENLQRLINARQNIDGAIVTKEGTVNPGDGLEEYPADILTIPSGGGGSGAATKDVNFYDYDGTVVNSYTAAEFAELAAMPDNPSHDGLVAQGWNWSLADAKAYVAKYGKLNIGQMYITDDGKTRVYISLHDGRLSPIMGLGVNGSVDIDWGDDTEHTTLTGSSESTAVLTQPHDYASEGEYVIIITPSSGSTFGFVGDSATRSKLLIKNSTAASLENRVYQGAVTAIEIGDSVTSIGQYAFSSCSTLSAATIPDGVTTIGGNAFTGCYALTAATIPDGVTSIDQTAFSYCYALTSVTIPDSVTSIGQSAFTGCSMLTSVTIPDGVTGIGQSAFSYCYALSSITIPDGVTSIGQSAFSYCYALSSIIIPDGVTTIDGDAFHSCYALTSVTIPDSVTSIGQAAFSYCYALTAATIPDDVTTIGSNAFSYCSTLSSVTIPDGVTTIGSNAFQKCTGLGFVKFESTTPPTVSNANAFSGIPTDCIIYAPALVINLYVHGTKYPSAASYTYAGFATYESGVTLPATTSDETHTLTWYANVDDLQAGTNPITVGNGNEVYAKATAI